jgi:diguanylate cyclase
MSSLASTWISRLKPRYPSRPVITAICAANKATLWPWWWRNRGCCRRTFSPSYTRTLGILITIKFVPIAEESGLIVPLGQWVLLEACRQARTWMDAGLPPVRIAVNVSALQFAAKDFLSSVRAALISTGMNPHNLELELTETVLMPGRGVRVQTLRALKAIGVQLAVDDFGVGYSSFSYLRKFPLDALKVDLSFINDISSNPHNATTRARSSA